MEIYVGGLGDAITETMNTRETLFCNFIDSEWHKNGFMVAAISTYQGASRTLVVTG